jgi:hypothetical protein
LKLEDWFLPSNAVGYRKKCLNLEDWFLLSHAAGFIEVPETGRLSFVTVGGVPQGGRPRTQNFSLMLGPNACCLSENVYEIKLDIPNSMN